MAFLGFPWLRSLSDSYTNDCNKSSTDMRGMESAALVHPRSWLNLVIEYLEPAFCGGYVGDRQGAEVLSPYSYLWKAAEWGVPHQHRHLSPRVILHSTTSHSTTLCTEYRTTHFDRDPIEMPWNSYRPCSTIFSKSDLLSSYIFVVKITKNNNLWSVRVPLDFLAWDGTRI